MEKDEKGKARPKEIEARHDGMTSAFDAHGPGTTVRPPALALTAEPVARPSEAAQGEQSEEGEYAPETIIFEIGGHADPQNPAGGGGMGIKVAIPPDLDGPTALVHVVMAMLRVTEAEAKVAIVREGLQWTDYRPEGHGTDGAGNVIHLMRFRPQYAERLAHEPASLRPRDPQDMERYKAFKLYLLDHDGDNIRDPYVQYDRWAREGNFFVEDVKSAGAGMMGMDMGPARIAYEESREAVVQFVVWERLRAKRESLASGIQDETTSAKSMVEQMADSFPSMVDLAAMQYYMPEALFLAWNKIHAGMILAQGALEKGDVEPLAQDDLGSQVYGLAYRFAEFAEDRFGTWSGAKKRYHAFDADDVLEILRLTEAKEMDLEQGTRLLRQYYKLTFAMMEVAGRSMAHGTEKTLLQPHEDAELNQAGRQLENQGRVGTAMLGLLESHPTAKRVNATFYPEAETKDFRQMGEKDGPDGHGDDWSNGIPLDLYLWHDAETGEWVLEDFGDVRERKENRCAGAVDAPVPAALFAQLDSKLRFPKGALYYRCPDEGSYRILRTTAPTSVAEWLRYVAMAGLAVGMAVATMGASIPAQVIMIGSSLVMAGAEGFDMHALHRQGMLTSEKVMVHSALIASCVLGAASGGLGMLGKAGRLAEGATIVRVVAGLQVGADGICVAAFTQEAFEGLKAAADDPEGLTFTRLLAFSLQMGMNGLMLYGMKGSMAEAAGMNTAGPHGAVEAKVEAEAKAKNVEVVSPKAHERALSKLEAAGIPAEEMAGLTASQAKALERAAKYVRPDELLRYWKVFKSLGMEGQAGELLLGFHMRKAWVVNAEAEPLALLEQFNYRSMDGSMLRGKLEVVRTGEGFGIRAVVPYGRKGEKGAFGGDLVLHPDKTVTVLGRGADPMAHPDGMKGAINEPVGTGYFRYMENGRVGKNQGGVNVLDISDWTWGKNNAWLQAALDRGDVIRFISDPSELGNLFRNVDDFSKGLTVTGEELGVLMIRGYAPDPVTGIVGKIKDIAKERIPESWFKVRDIVYDQKKFADIDRAAYREFMHGSKAADCSPKIVKKRGTDEIEAVQTEFFGGTPNLEKALN